MNETEYAVKSREKTQRRNGQTHHRIAEPRPIAGPAADASLPIFTGASGLYEWKWPGPIAPVPISREELRLDVDGRYPMMTASGVGFGALAVRAHWIATLSATGPDSWKGAIWFKDATMTGSFPYTNLSIKRFGTTATVTFTGSGVLKLVRPYLFKSPFFHPVEFEFDAAAGTSAVTSMLTHDHPTRPATLPAETLTLETAFRRAGFLVTKSNADSIVPLAGAGPNARWSDAEMHDAMQVHWSRFADKPQWSLWTFFASLHESGTSLGGIMFDDVGPNHRQGTAIFEDAFISVAPGGDPVPTAWVRRMRFWTAAHEMGHAFNLAHSWQKSLSVGGAGPWIPLANEPEARSFMNYPFNVSGGQSAFFADFQFRFSDGELLFMRHAPGRFVQMGNANWFDHHGFQQANVSPEPALRFELRVNRDPATYQFLEPVVLELKLTNVTDEPQLIEENFLQSLDHMTFVIKKDNREAREYIPFARYCWRGKKSVLMPGESVYESLFVAAGRNGWDVADPGYYIIQAVMNRDGEDVVSNPLTIRVAPPRSYEEEFLAQDFFTGNVGRILAFDGSRYLDRGNDVLREVSEQLADRRVAFHARVALGMPLAREYKLLDLDEPDDAAAAADPSRGEIDVQPPKEEKARENFTAALVARNDAAAESLGHVDYKYYADQYSEFLSEQGDDKAAAEVQADLGQTLSARNVLDRVVQEVAERREAYENDAGRRTSRQRHPKKPPR